MRFNISPALEVTLVDGWIPSCIYLFLKSCFRDQHALREAQLKRFAGTPFVVKARKAARQRCAEATHNKLMMRLNARRKRCKPRMNDSE